MFKIRIFSSLLLQVGRAFSQPLGGWSAAESRWNATTGADPRLDPCNDTPGEWGRRIEWRNDFWYFQWSRM